MQQWPWSQSASELWPNFDALSPLLDMCIAASVPGECQHHTPHCTSGARPCSPGCGSSGTSFRYRKNKPQRVHILSPIKHLSTGQKSPVSMSRLTFQSAALRELSRVGAVNLLVMGIHQPLTFAAMARTAFHSCLQSALSQLAKDNQLHPDTTTLLCFAQLCLIALVPFKVKVEPGPECNIIPWKWRTLFLYVF